MRSIFVVIPNDKLEIAKSALDSIGTTYYTISDPKNTLIIISAPAATSEQIIETLEKVGVGRLYGTIYVHSLEYATEKSHIPHVHRASREEIEADIMEMSTLTVNFIVYSILASLLAGISLLTDNILILIASMIIAPAIGPILGLSLGIIIDNKALTHRALKAELLGLSLSILTGIILGLIAPHEILTDSIIVRAYPTIIDLSFAIIAGAAAALSIISVVSVALVGVAIAASIVPPAVNIGIGIAYAIRGFPSGLTIAYGSTLLLLVNFLSIYLMSIIFFWLTGIKPKLSERKHRIIRRQLKKKTIVIMAILLIIAFPIINESLTHYNVMKFEEKLRSDIASYIRNNHPSITTLDISVKYFPTNKSARIIVYLGSPKAFIGLSEEIKNFVYNKYKILCHVYVFYAESSRILSD